jgi:riboflavin synthase
MFTGLIEEIGTIKSITKNVQSIIADFNCSTVLENTKIGDSIAINGVCQTVTNISKNSFTVEISSTTLSKTTLRSLQKIKYVNLERAMKLEDRLGGHLIQGHVNGTAKVINVIKDNSMYLLKIQLNKHFMKYIINEGSISIDGISLTVSEKEREQNNISLRIIPHTFSNTILQYKKPGDLVNIETDMIGRYIESLMHHQDKNELSLNNLRKWGF